MDGNLFLPQQQQILLRLVHGEVHVDHVREGWPQSWLEGVATEAVSVAPSAVSVQGVGQEAGVEARVRAAAGAREVGQQGSITEVLNMGHTASYTDNHQGDILEMSNTWAN